MTIGLGQPPQSRTAGRQAVGPPETLPNTTDWYGRFRCVADEKNDYLIDRKAQKTTSYTGINAIFLQDQAVTESMGPIYDRTERAPRHQRRDGDPHAQAPDRRREGAARYGARCRRASTIPTVYQTRSGGVVLPDGANWIEATRSCARRA